MILATDLMTACKIFTILRGSLCVESGQIKAIKVSSTKQSRRSLDLPERREDDVMFILQETLRAQFD